MKTLSVQLGDRSYPIDIGPGLLFRSDRIVNGVRGRQVMVVTNRTIAPLYLERVQDLLMPFEQRAVILPDGEEFKNLDTLNRVFDALLEHRFNRGCTLVALGGGVVGDITGFAAATYQRGVAFIQIPTTLLAQVDSSVGGKTGVNHALGKNMIGAFHQPQCVIADTDTLSTLPERELSAGIAEIIKTALIRDAEFFVWLEDNLDSLLKRDPQALSFAIERSCRNKAEVVAADERERGSRALLNLGHTFAHAIETGLGYGSWLHGEAVAAGLYLAADLSARHGWIDIDDVFRIEALLRRAQLPTRAPQEVSADHMRELMAVDKKALDGGLRLVLLRSIGHAVVTADFEPRKLTDTLEAGR